MNDQKSVKTSWVLGEDLNNVSDSPAISQTNSKKPYH